MASHLFFASTAFNMLTASMTALSLPDGDHKVLALIDQPQDLTDFAQAVLNWPTAPFNQVLLTSHQAKGKKKRALRQASFKNIDALITEHQPDHIYTGNDRRIEFQYAMAQSGKHTQGIYIDDGGYSYLGRKTSWLRDQVVDNLVKKISYGFWWRQPKTIGASSWINKSILAFPAKAFHLLKEKPIEQLPLNLHHQCFQQLAKQVFEQNSTNQQYLTSSQVTELDLVLLLPHQSVYNPAINNAFNQVLTGSSHSAIKHHPRTTEQDSFNLVCQQQLPSSVPMEILLPLITNKCHVVGDISTALLTAKWLKPEIKCTALALANTDQQWLELLALLEIEIQYVK